MGEKEKIRIEVKNRRKKLTERKNCNITPL